ncbi:MarR family winged helix-turn-helix transcriptional regulator [Rhizobium sp. CC-YZS058]|uniref:MarR family winged helix-turn-helix transcriptional regulator n=1 Tax=Rhizobium sp. CC-YZS058 TaxID=3042153 RepID=UPI002B0588F5|nr:MarR family winged helix-turn-helix transcriptional regulator [Rhizobium sp. CC-YZS058]MEA3535923.1 MarR family winged helix-turn-helix transcriptional regulator [Rhizobium sp. CC-YZS058]
MAMIARLDEWNRAKASGVNPTQLAILTLLEGRGSGMGVKDVAAHLGVSQPTATDSILALEKKGLVVKRADAADKRAVSVALTEDGLAALAHEGGDLGEQAVGSLEDREQEELLLALVKMIRHLQEQNAIPVQRMCVTCRYFGPFAHPDEDRPHHCHLVNAAFGQRDLRVDCREHEQADPAIRAATWAAFQTG